MGEQYAQYTLNTEKYLEDMHSSTNGFDYDFWVMKI
jgi:hypothetical protein